VATVQDRALALNLIQRVCVGDILTRGAEQHGARLALVDGPDELSDAELDRRANAVGRALLDLGLERHEHVGILSRNSWELVTTYFACEDGRLLGRGEVGEIELTLLAHPAVTDCAVVGLPHEHWGEAVTAFVAGDASEDDLPAWCRDRLGAFKVPKRILVVDEFAHTVTGRIQKQPLREANHDLYA
jgi:acyl-CoA synthetase (AMP-forming)/AMP-acid ligase II